MELKFLTTRGIQGVDDLPSDLHLFQIRGKWCGEAFVNADRIVWEDRGSTHGWTRVEALSWAARVCEDRIDYVIGRQDGRRIEAIECLTVPPAHRYETARKPLNEFC